jgi:hypothetical protein
MKAWNLHDGGAWSKQAQLFKLQFASPQFMLLHGSLADMFVLLDMKRLLRSSSCWGF